MHSGKTGDGASLPFGPGAGARERARGDRQSRHGKDHGSSGEAYEYEAYARPLGPARPAKLAECQNDSNCPHVGRAVSCLRHIFNQSSCHLSDRMQH